MKSDRTGIPFPLIALIAVSLTLYSLFAYTLERTQTTLLLGMYALLFSGFLLLSRYGKLHFKTLLIAGILFRLVMLFAAPNLSQDFYRFIWDGELILLGIDPYVQSPSALLDQVQEQLPFAQELFEGMGSLSASHYSNYPPLNQVFFALSALGGKSLLGKIAVLKVIMLLADVAILSFGIKILRILKRPESLILWYFLNPFVIIELSGNLHFEGVMMAFFLGGLWFLFQKRHLPAALCIAASISVKLIPLIFIPLLYMHCTDGKWFPGPKKTLEAIAFTGFILLLTGLSFTPFTSFNNLEHFMESVNLWFSNFEFNASLYYLAREAGYWIKGYNTIGSIAPWIPVITLFTVIGLCFDRRNGQPQQLIISMLWAITVYLFISTTVHPWYLVTPLLLSVITNKKYVMVWTALVMLSYITYANTSYKEWAIILWVEYGITFLIFYLEMVRNKEIRAF